MKHSVPPLWHNKWSPKAVFMCCSSSSILACLHRISVIWLKSDNNVRGKKRGKKTERESAHGTVGRNFCVRKMNEFNDQYWNGHYKAAIDYKNMLAIHQDYLQIGLLRLFLKQKKNSCHLTKWIHSVDWEPWSLLRSFMHIDFSLNSSHLPTRKHTEIRQLGPVIQLAQAHNWRKKHVSPRTFSRQCYSCSIILVLQN